MAIELFKCIDSFDREGLEGPFLEDEVTRALLESGVIKL